MSNGIGISANEDTVESVLARNYKYRVPDYQRQYSWDEEQWNAFWDDLTALKGEQTHFLGSLVVIERSGGLNELDVLEIVDGQQRLTTISILLVVMRERYRAEGKQTQVEAIDSDYLWEKDLDQNRHQNLTLSRFDDDNYCALLEQQWNAVDDGLFKDAFEFYAEKIENIPLEEVDAIRKRLLKSMTLVSIECDGEQSAFRLFETLNNRGMELSSVDLMKNHLFSVAAQRNEIDYKRVREKWQEVIDVIVPEINKPSKFFRHYIMSTPEPDYDDGVSDYMLYEVFQDLLEDLLTEDGITVEKFLDDLAIQSKLYVKITNCKIDLYDDAGNEAINAKLRQLQMIKSGQARTLLLRIFMEFDTSNRAMEALLVLEKFLVRWKIANYATGGALDRIYSDVCSNAFEGDDPVESMRMRFLERAPSDAEFRAGIENKRMRLNDRTKYLLHALEEKRFGGEKAVGVSEVDLEHIAPRASFSAKKYSKWPNVLDTTEAMFEEYRDRLGNLTLLEPDINIEIGADPFDSKRVGYERSAFAMTRAIATDYETWTLEEIQDRTETLSKMATDLWSLEQ